MLKLHFKSNKSGEEESKDKKESKDKSESEEVAKSPVLDEIVSIDLEALIGIIQGINLGNSGTWLDPIKVDNFVEINYGLTDPGNPIPVIGRTAGNNRVIEFDVDAIAETLVEGTLEGSNDQNPLDFIEIKRIDKGQWSFPDRHIWNQIFELNEDTLFSISPSGSLFLMTDDEGKVKVKFQNADILRRLIAGNGFFALSYSLCFHVTIPFHRNPFYCLVDPIVQVRANPQ